MGTGAAVRERGGFAILRACEAIVDATLERALPAGSVHVTTAGSLPCKAVIHCVASDLGHRSSAAIVRSCVSNALQAAGKLQCATVAMPVFASGHAHFAFRDALALIGDELRNAKTHVQHVLIVIKDASREAEAQSVIRKSFPGAETMRAEQDEPAGSWFSDPWDG